MLRHLAALLVLGATIFAGGCTSEETGLVEMTGDPQAHQEGDPRAEPDPEPDPDAGVGPGVVETPPPGVPQVKVTLAEWAIARDVDSVRAGQTYFLADNAGPSDAHELVIIKTDLAPGELPEEDGRVPLEMVSVAGAIAPFAAGSAASIVLDLESGNYALICNIAEVEDGRLESHYQLGMYTPFTVED